jgi:phosphohistidine swiveling domain-containing protein
MKLISANALKEYCMRAIKSDDDFRRVSLATLASEIDAQPTAYDVDKVVAQLEKEKNPLYREDGGLMGERAVIGIDKAIEIVKGGGVDAKTDS